MALGEYTIELILTEADLERSMGREPEDEEEFEAWAHSCEESLFDGNVDWDAVFEYGRAAFSIGED